MTDRSIEADRLRHADRPNTYPAGRVCAAVGCGTRLSRYNRLVWCGAHIIGAPRPAPTDRIRLPKASTTTTPTADAPTATTPTADAPTAGQMTLPGLCESTTDRPPAAQEAAPASSDITDAQLPQPDRTGAHGGAGAAQDRTGAAEPLGLVMTAADRRSMALAAVVEAADREHAAAAGGGVRPAAAHLGRALAEASKAGVPLAAAAEAAGLAEGEVIDRCAAAAGLPAASAPADIDRPTADRWTRPQPRRI